MSKEVGLFNFIIKRFNISDLKTLCFEFKVDYDNISGENKQDKARELILYLKRRDKLNEFYEFLTDHIPEMHMSLAVIDEIQSLKDLPSMSEQHFEDRVKTNEDVISQYCVEFLKYYTLDLVKDFNDLYNYYNVDGNRNVDLRNETINDLKEWIENWITKDTTNRKNILLMTGPAGCGKSWLTFSLITKLLSSTHIFSIQGSKLPQRLPPMDNNSFTPIFIFDDRHMTFEKNVNQGQVPALFVNQLVNNCSNLAGPVIISMRKDTWNLLTSQTLNECLPLTEYYMEKNFEIIEISASDQVAREVADKVARSFYERVDNKDPPYSLFHVEPDVERQIIERSENNLVIIRIFFEEMYRLAIELEKDSYCITSEDVDKIISDPNYYVLSQLFDSYSSKATGELKERETVEILAGLYYIAESGSMSLGALKQMWNNYYLKKARPLPIKVYEYLDNLFTSPKPYKLPPTLFDIDKYGSIISFHASVENTIKQLCNDPALLYNTLSQKSESLREEFKSEVQKVDQNLEYIKQIRGSIDIRLKKFKTDYSNDIEKYISSTLNEWEKRENKSIYSDEAYYFLSAFKEYVEPYRKFNIQRYQIFKSMFESILKTFEFLLDRKRGRVSTTVNRVIYYLLEIGSYGETGAEAKLETNEGKLLYQYGTYEDDLDLMRERFFKNKDIFSNPILSNDREKLLLFRRVGLALMTIGQLNASEKLYEKSYQIAVTRNEWIIDANKIMQLQSELYIHEGRSSESITASNDSITSYIGQLSGTENITSNDVWGVQSITMTPIHLIICCLGYQAWILHLLGLDDYAGITFEEAEKRLNQFVKMPNDGTTLERRYHLCDLWGIYYADYLLRTENEECINLAKCITDDNLKYAQRNHLTEIKSQCNRVLGDIECWYGDNKIGNIDSKQFYDRAEQKFENALDHARIASHHPVIIEALLGLARFKIRKKQFDEARKYLEEAKSLCIADSNLNKTQDYEFYKVDVYIALANNFLNKEKEEAKNFLNKEKEEAKKFAGLAKNISDKILYRIGQSQSVSLLTKCDSL